MSPIMLPDFQTLSLSFCILLTTYATYLSGTPPNPTPYDSTNPDSMSLVVSPSALFIRRFINVSLGVYHAYICLTYPSPSPVTCPNPSQLAPHLVTWTPYSLACIATILLGCYVRLSAFSALDTDFTFRLRAPKKLITAGLYNYVQHPSYTGKALIVLGNWFLLQNLDGPVGCWLPKWIMRARPYLTPLSYLIAFGIIRVTWRRVNDEEKMLKETFGKEWEVWHARTKRFVPGLL